MGRLPQPAKPAHLGEQWAPPPPNAPYTPDNPDQKPGPNSSSLVQDDPYSARPASYPPQTVPFLPPPSPPHVDQYRQQVGSFPTPQTGHYSQPLGTLQPPAPIQGVPFVPPPPATATTGQTVPQPQASRPVPAAYGGHQAGYGNATTAYGSDGFGTAPWTTELFGCLEDPTNACATAGILYCLIASFVGIPRIYSCSYQTKYRLLEAPAPDWLTHFLCEWCAPCQAYRELKSRGINP